MVLGLPDEIAHTSETWREAMSEHEAWEWKRDCAKRKWERIWRLRGIRSGPMRKLLLKGQENPKNLFETRVEEKW